MKEEDEDDDKKLVFIHNVVCYTTYTQLGGCVLRDSGKKRTCDSRSNMKKNIG